MLPPSSSRRFWTFCFKRHRRAVKMCFSRFRLPICQVSPSILITMFYPTVDGPSHMGDDLTLLASWQVEHSWAFLDQTICDAWGQRENLVASLPSGFSPGAGRWSEASHATTLVLCPLQRAWRALASKIQQSLWPSNRGLVGSRDRQKDYIKMKRWRMFNLSCEIHTWILVSDSHVFHTLM